MVCGAKYTPELKEHGYCDDIRMQAIRMYIGGMSLRWNGRLLRVSHQSVSNWVKAHAAQLPPAPQPAEVKVVEMDELHPFIEDKK